MLSWLVVVVCAATLSACAGCRRYSLTRASGTHAPRYFCSGDLIFSDHFDTFDFEKWKHSNTLSGGGVCLMNYLYTSDPTLYRLTSPEIFNWEFQWYGNNRSNSFVEAGRLHLRPSLTADQFGDAFLTGGTLNVQGGSPADQCTDPRAWGCERTGTTEHILNPVKSAQLRTIDSFQFTYGIVEVQAKMPAGDWLWPAIWLLPSHNAYGTWPASGEIDLTESRGNRQLMINDVNIGVEQAGSALHFGPYPELDASATAHWIMNSSAEQGYNKHFHRYRMDWTPDGIRFFIDDIELGNVVPGKGGFWELGQFNENINNPWKYGTKMAPFDQKFYFIISLAVGGITFFPDNATNPEQKPWTNNSTKAATEFWNGRSDWLPTWALNTSDEADLQVDYVRVWAL